MCGTITLVKTNLADRLHRISVKLANVKHIYVNVMSFLSFFIKKNAWLIIVWHFFYSLYEMIKKVYIALLRKNVLKIRFFSWSRWCFRKSWTHFSWVSSKVYSNLFLTWKFPDFPCQKYTIIYNKKVPWLVMVLIIQLPCKPW